MQLNEYTEHPSMVKTMEELRILKAFIMMTVMMCIVAMMMMLKVHLMKNVVCQ